jgi:hypothetical protein
MVGSYVVKSATAPAGSLGQIHLASGQGLSMPFVAGSNEMTQARALSNAS